MSPTSATLNSRRMRGTDNGAHRRTGDRHGGNRHFVKSFQGQDVRNSPRTAASESYSYFWLFGPNFRSQRLLFAIATCRTPTDVAPEKSFRPFYSFDSRICSFACVSNIIAKRGNGEDSSAVREDGAVDFTRASVKNDNSWQRRGIFKSFNLGSA